MPHVLPGGAVVGIGGGGIRIPPSRRAGHLRAPLRGAIAHSRAPPGSFGFVCLSVACFAAVLCVAGGTVLFAQAVDITDQAPLHEWRLRDAGTGILLPRNATSGGGGGGETAVVRVCCSRTTEEEIPPSRCDTAREAFLNAVIGAALCLCPLACFAVRTLTLSAKRTRWERDAAAAAAFSPGVELRVAVGAKRPPGLHRDDDDDLACSGYGENEAPPVA